LNALTRERVWIVWLKGVTVDRRGGELTGIVKIALK
jgi:hypothetical protein